MRGNQAEVQENVGFIGAETRRKVGLKGCICPPKGLPKRLRFFEACTANRSEMGANGTAKGYEMSEKVAQNCTK